MRAKPDVKAPAQRGPADSGGQVSFWEQHNAAELELKVAARLPQDAPMECIECGHVGTDVMLGYCAECAPPITQV